MEFLVERMNDQNALPFRARLGLVQDRYSYLEFVHPMIPPSLHPRWSKRENLTDQEREMTVLQRDLVNRIQPNERVGLNDV